jgi:hypothetical protein
MEALGDAADDPDAEINTIVLSSPDAMQAVQALQQRNATLIAARKRNAANAVKAVQEMNSIIGPPPTPSRMSTNKYTGKTPKELLQILRTQLGLSPGSVRVQ